MAVYTVTANFSVCNLANMYTGPYTADQGAGYNSSQGIWDLLWCSCGIAHHGESLIFVSQEFSTSISKNFHFGRDTGH